MSDGPRSLDEIGRSVDRHDKELGEVRGEIREQYVRKDVYIAERDADRARIKRLEDDDSNKATGNRTWLLGLLQTVLAVLLGAAAAYLTARGGH